MDNSTEQVKQIGAVSFRDELQGDRGKRIVEFMKRLAQKGEFGSGRAAVLKLVDRGLDAEGIKL